ncbi:basic proline-rich protein-like [Vulpes lagopus]|uniref:basic proline-rich protein-like n=1 Tax=Vulpes lagopus TaxID=494514 RepID=UPI001BC9114D|nr:basic proline-rich protein-like [Vulpes lagopus]
MGVDDSWLMPLVKNIITELALYAPAHHLEYVASTSSLQQSCCSSKLDSRIAGKKGNKERQRPDPNQLHLIFGSRSSQRQQVQIPLSWKELRVHRALRFLSCQINKPPDRRWSDLERPGATCPCPRRPVGPLHLRGRPRRRRPVVPRGPPWSPAAALRLPPPPRASSRASAKASGASGPAISAAHPPTRPEPSAGRRAQDNTRTQRVLPGPRDAGQRARPETRRGAELCGEGPAMDPAPPGLERHRRHRARPRSGSASGRADAGPPRGTERDGALVPQATEAPSSEHEAAGQDPPPAGSPPAARAQGTAGSSGRGGSDEERVDGRIRKLARGARRPCRRVTGLGGSSSGLSATLAAEERRPRTPPGTPGPCTAHSAPRTRTPGPQTAHPAPRTLHRALAPPTSHPAPCTRTPGPRTCTPGPLTRPSQRPRGRTGSERRGPGAGGRPRPPGPQQGARGRGTGRGGTGRAWGGGTGRAWGGGTGRAWGGGTARVGPLAQPRHRPRARRSPGAPLPPLTPAPSSARVSARARGRRPGCSGIPPPASPRARDAPPQTPAPRGPRGSPAPRPSRRRPDVAPTPGRERRAGDAGPGPRGGRQQSRGRRPPPGAPSRRRFLPGSAPRPRPRGHSGRPALRGDQPLRPDPGTSGPPGPLTLPPAPPAPRRPQDSDPRPPPAAPQPREPPHRAPRRRGSLPRGRSRSSRSLGAAAPPPPPPRFKLKFPGSGRQSPGARPAPRGGSPACAPRTRPQRGNPPAAPRLGHAPPAAPRPRGHAPSDRATPGHGPLATPTSAAPRLYGHAPPSATPPGRGLPRDSPHRPPGTRGCKDALPDRELRP